MKRHQKAGVMDNVLLAIEHTTHRPQVDISEMTCLSSDLRLESRLGRLALAIELEDIFDLELPEEIVTGFATVGDIVGYVGKRWDHSASLGY